MACAVQPGGSKQHFEPALSPELKISLRRRPCRSSELVSFKFVKAFCVLPFYDVKPLDSTNECHELERYSDGM